MDRVNQIGKEIITFYNDLPFKAAIFGAGGYEVAKNFIYNCRGKRKWRIVLRTTKQSTEDVRYFDQGYKFEHNKKCACNLPSICKYVPKSVTKLNGLKILFTYINLKNVFINCWIVVL